MAKSVNQLQIQERKKQSCYTRGHVGGACMKSSQPEPSGKNSITALLQQLSEGNREVEVNLIPQIYPELRQLAARYMRRERRNHTLQPTALVHEAYERLVQQPQIPWQSRAHMRLSVGSTSTSINEGLPLSIAAFNASVISAVVRTCRPGSP